MVLDTAFTCPNGHSFTANAKLRARCTECGQLARRSFQQDVVKKSESQTTESEVKARVEHKAIKTPVLLRQGKKMPARKTTTPKTVAKTTAKKPITKPPVKKVAAKKVAVVANGLVSTRKVSRGITPSIKRRPKRTAPARHVVSERKGLGGYAADMMRKFGFQ